METDALAKLIDQKHAVLAKLWDHARRQLELVDDGDLNQVLRDLAAKNKLLTQIQAIEKKIDPFRDQDPESRQWRSPDLRARVATAAAECESMLAEIVKLEKQSSERMSARRDQAALRLQEATSASEARSGYLRAAGPQSGRLDVTSQ